MFSTFRMSTRSPYSGPHRKLVLAFDVGTTFSGISYCILDPGEVPEIRGVTRFPAQEQVGGDSKIPTIIYYDQEGRVRAVGAEAAREGIEDEAEDGQWIKAEWFKLHLRPKGQSSAYVTHKIPPLPRGKSAIDVFADFLRYLHQCARSFIEETHANGVELWRNLKHRTEFVLTHPNGWEGAQQSMMRTAALQAGLIHAGPSEGQSDISFVTEGEASLHFCVQSGLTNDAIKSGKGLLIVDAGGGTIDISAYRQTSPHNQSYEEIAAPQCHFHGSIFVTGQARNFLDGLLGQTRFSGDIPHIARCFDKGTKLRFRNADESQYIKFGGIRDKDLKLNIRSGQLKLLGSDVASFFEPSVQCIIKSIKEQCEAATTEISSVFLVGGFAASDWLYQNLKNAFVFPNRLDVSRPDSHVNKAVADGAVSFYIDHFVSARVSKFAYGIETYTKFDPYKAEHKRRINTTFTTPRGYLGIEGIFSVVLPQNTKVSETQEFIKSYRQSASKRSDLETITVPILSYRGDLTSSDKWMDEEESMYSTLCNVKGDTSELCKSLQPQVKLATFYEINFDVVLALGLTELKAHICWEENGIKRRSPAEVIYDPN